MPERELAICGGRVMTVFRRQPTYQPNVRFRPIPVIPRLCYQSAMPLPRIFFDGNSADEGGGYHLWFNQSLADLDLYREEVAEGAEVIIYDPGEFEMTAKLRFDENCGWVADPVPGTIKYLDGSG